jgi:opacity protein-like surface antigen
MLGSVVFSRACRGPKQMLCLLVLLAGPRLAHASAKEFTLSLEPAFALVYLTDANQPRRTVYGGGGGLDVSYGVSESIAVRVTGAWTAHAIGATGSTPAGILQAYHAGAGITYVFDVLRLVPYIDFSIGLLGTARPGPNGRTDISNQFGIQVGVGVDYLISRTLAVGFVVRYHVYLTSLTQIPAYLYLGPRIAFHFGG